MTDRRCLQRVEILKQMKVLDSLSLHGRASLPPAGRNPQKNGILRVLKPQWRTVVIPQTVLASVGVLADLLEDRWRGVTPASPGVALKT